MDCIVQSYTWLGGNCISPYTTVCSIGLSIKLFLIIILHNYCALFISYHLEIAFFQLCQLRFYAQDIEPDGLGCTGAGGKQTNKKRTTTVVFRPSPV